MSSLSKFLVKYAGEAVSIAGALNSVLSGIALPTSERNKVQEVISKLQGASDSIMKSIKDVTEPVIKISKSDIEAAVKAQLPTLVKAQLADMIKEDVAKAVALALEEYTALNTTSDSSTTGNS